MTAMKVDSGPSLDDLFADEKPSLPSMKSHLETLSDLKNPAVMILFYKRLFPFKSLFRWLNGGDAPSKNFTHREFAFTLANEAYLRYLSFATPEDLKKEVVRLNPARFEIGPVYTGRPKDKKTLLKAAFRPVLREFIVDIDMTDYDSIRTCCQDKGMCKRCWQFIAVAVKVLDTCLREDFGFTHLLWVYSGRRGIHCWVSDASAQAMSDDERRAIVNYLEIIKGEKAIIHRPLHPSLLRAIPYLKKGFSEVVLGDQNCFAVEKQWDYLLSILPDKENSVALKKMFASKPNENSKSRWEETRKIPKNSPKYKDALEDVIIQYTYPRIDTEVSKHMNHLLKSPFCVHPGTGKVCVPLDPSTVESFDPDTVPTVGKLLMELEEASRRGDVDAGWEKTSLNEYVELFNRHCDGIIRDANKKRREEGKDAMEF